MAFIQEYHFFVAHVYNFCTLVNLAHRVYLIADKYFLADNTADADFVAHFNSRVFQARKFQLAEAFGFFAFTAFFGQFALAFRLQRGQALAFAVL